MTIEFRCPKCDALIAFDSKHSGKKAHCQSCRQGFIVPEKSFEKAKKIEPEPEFYQLEPIPGFYHALFVDSWKMFINLENAIPLVFVIAVTSFKFFLGRGVCCMNYLAYIVVWGWLLGFYLNIIYETAYDSDRLPEIYLGTSITFFFHMLKPFFIFAITLLIIQMPLLIVMSFSKDKGLTFQNMWEVQSNAAVFARIFFAIGMFFFPAAILTVAVGKDLTLLRPDYIFAAVFKTFIPYLVVTAILILAGFIETKTKPCYFTGRTTYLLNMANLALNLIVQILAIIAMRAIGLLHRHYSCYMKY